MIEPDFDLTIIGGGVIGLSILHKASARGMRALLLERHETCGRETSSRNGEVIHGGMYYPPGSLKARLCVEGRRQMYEFARRHDVPAVKCGKVIVAVNEWEQAALENLAAAGMESGVEDLRFLSQRELAEIAPGARAVAALHSPHTGVINAHGFMRALQAQAEADGGVVMCGAEVTGLGPTYGGWEVDYVDDKGEASATSLAVVNAAGLQAQRIMRMAGLDPASANLALYPCKGSYFAVGGASRERIRGLIFPAPESNLQGTGIHTLVDFGGGVRLGPNIEYVEETDEYDYSVPDCLGDVFHSNVSRYLPFLRRSDIYPDIAGIGPRLYGPGMPARDFHISHETMWNLNGFINLAGIDSPGLTACLAIGDMVADMFVRETDL